MKHNFLITGGAGYLGSYLVDQLIEQDLIKEKLGVFSRDELKHFRQKTKVTDTRVSWAIGDVRDFDRVAECFQGIDVVVHAAAMKHLDACEQNPEECIKTNVIGTENVIRAAKSSGVKHLILISTDKAVEPVSAYGNSKQTAEKLTLRANSTELKANVIRLGNLLGSSGSILEMIRQMEYGASFPLYHEDLTRFADSNFNAFKLLLTILEKDMANSILIPRLEGFKVQDLISHFRPDLKVETLSGRSFEKLHEDLVAVNELERVLETASYYVIPREKLTIDQALDQYGMIPSGIKSYNSRSTDKVTFETLNLSINS